MVLGVCLNFRYCIGGGNNSLRFERFERKAIAHFMSDHAIQVLIQRYFVDCLDVFCAAGIRFHGKMKMAKIGIAAHARIAIRKHNRAGRWGNIFPCKYELRAGVKQPLHRMHNFHLAGSVD